MDSIQELRCVFCLRGYMLTRSPWTHSLNGASSFDVDVSGWDIAKVTAFDGAFNSCTAFNYNLCSFGNTIDITATVTGMFGTSGCDETIDPDFGASPIGPFCRAC